MKIDSIGNGYRPISSIGQRGSRKKVDKDNRVACKTGQVIFAFLTGAGIATTAFLVASKVRKAVSPSAEQILKKCDRAFDALDNQISHTLAV